MAFANGMQPVSLFSQYSIKKGLKIKYISVLGDIRESGGGGGGVGELFNFCVPDMMRRLSMEQKYWKDAELH